MDEQEEEFDEKKTRGGDRLHYSAFAFLLLLGTGLRFAYLFQPLRYDEVLTFFAYTSHPLTLALTKNQPPNNHLLHTLFVHLSIGLFGNAEWALRVPAFFAGVLIMPFTYLVFRKLYNRSAGFVAMALVVPSLLLINYSTNSRGYTMQTLFFLVLILIGAYLKEKSTPMRWVTFALFGFLILYTMPTSVYFLGAVVLWLGISALVKDTSDGRWRFIAKLAGAVAASGIVTVLLYIPVLLRSGLETITANPMVEPMHNLSDFIVGNFKLFRSVWFSWNVDVNLLIGIALAACFVVSIVFHRKMSRDKVNLAVVTIGWCLLLIIAQRSVSFIRSWMPLLPLYLGFASAGLVFFTARSLRALQARGVKFKPSQVLFVVVVLAFSIFLCSMVVASTSAYQTDELGFPHRAASFKDCFAITSFLQKTLRAGDIVRVDHFVESTLEFDFLKEGIPAGYLADNLQGAECVTKPSRTIYIESFSEGHTVELRADEWRKVKVLKEFPYSRILVVEQT